MMHKFTHIATYSRPIVIAPGDIQQRFGVWGHVPALNAQVEITTAMYPTIESAQDVASLLCGWNDLEAPEWEEEDEEPVMVHATGAVLSGNTVQEEPAFLVVGKLTAEVDEDGTVRLTSEADDD